MKDAAEAAGSYVLLVDDGDSIQGEPMGTMTRGEANIRLMNALGYDIAIPGNHEFDYGVDRFLELAEMAEYPYISCNFNREGELLFEPYIIREFDGVKIAFVGVTTPKTLTTSTPAYFQDEEGNYIYGFLQDKTGEAVYSAVQQAVDDARDEGAAYVIVMGHVGNEAECEPWTYADILEHTAGIDAFLDGHSHDTDKVVMKNRDGRQVIRQACGTKLEGIGWMRISAVDGSIDTGLYTWNNPVSAPKLLGIQNEMSEVVDGALASLGEWLNTKAGVSAQTQTMYDPTAMNASGKPVRIIRAAETNLGDLLTDAFRIQTGADVALACGASIRANLPKGDITLNDLVSVYPFGNHISIREVTGQQLLDALEWSVKDVPSEFKGFLQVSGLTFEIHTYIESSCQTDENDGFAGVAGEYRVKNVMVAGEPLALDRTYTVAAVDYLLLNRGNGFTMFDGGKVILASGEPDYAVVASYIQDDLKGVIGDAYESPYGQERIVAVEEPIH